MFRMILMLFAFMWSAVLDTAGGGGSAGGEGGEGDPPPEKFEMTPDELSQRTTKAADDKVKELAGVLGVDLSNPADAKALIEAGRKANQQPADDKPAGAKSGDKSGEEPKIEDVIANALKPFTDRIQALEGKETARETAATERTRDEKLSAALKEAGVRDDSLEHVARYARSYDLKVDDKGELTGSKEAIAAAKAAFPQAFRGDGDTGTAADTTARDGKPRPKNLAEALTAHYSKS